MGTTTRAKPRRKTRGTTAAAGDPEFQRIPLNQIRPDPGMSRPEIDPVETEYLAKSLDLHGQHEPITVRRVPGRDKFLIINGERRWRAADQTSRVRLLKCQILDDPGEDEILLRRLTENLARDDFPLLELGEMLNKLMELRSRSMGGLAEDLGVHVDRVRRPLLLLRLPPQIQEMVRRGELKPSHAIKIKTAPPGDQLLIAKEVVKEGLSVEETREMVHDSRTHAGDPPRVKRKLWKFPFPGGRSVELFVLPEDPVREMRRMLHSVLTLLDDL